MDKAVSALGINLPQLIAQVLNFFILLVLLQLTLYKPILKMMDERRQKIAEGLNAADTARAEAAAAQVNIQAQLDTARKEGQDLSPTPRTSPSASRPKPASSPIGTAKRHWSERAAEIQLERDRRSPISASEFADITVLAAEKVINQSLDRQAHQRIIDETLAESTFSGN